MFLVLRALRRPITLMVLFVAVALGAVLAVRRAPIDIFPDLGIPVIYVVQPYAGMSPSQMESQIVTYYEYHFLYIAGIEHVESYSIQGMAMLKLYFHPGTDIAQSMAQVTAMTFRATSFMPPGTLPAFILRFDAGSIPVGQLVFSSETRSESEIQDLALYQVRPVLATLPGVSAPPPSGGKVRTIVVYADPEKLRSYRLSVDDLANALAQQNLTLPAGNVRLGDVTTIASTDAMVTYPRELEDVPLQMGSGPTVFVRDVARVEDAGDVVTNIALVNGRRTVYMPMTKRADASTVEVVGAIRAALPRMRALVPPDVKISLEFDQSVYVRNALRGLVEEGVLGAVLTGVVVFLFLGSLRSAGIVVLTIPFSILAAIICLRLAGQTLNIMTLGGLALAIGALVDEATVAIENIHTHLASGGEHRASIATAMGEVMLPRFLAMLCVVAVFTPALFMVGVSRALFPPLALAVAFSMIASFLISNTAVPVLSAWMLGGARGAAVTRPEHRIIGRLKRAQAGVTDGVLRRPRLFTLLYGAVCATALLLVVLLPSELFPRVDAGQLQIRVRAAPGTRLEVTEQMVREVDRTLREVVGADKVSVTLANIGQPQWTYPVNGIFVWNSGPQEALMLAALRPGKRPSVRSIEQELRTRLAKTLPGVSFSFEAGDIVSQVLNFGAPTPISVSVSGKQMGDVQSVAERLLRKMQALPALRDVQIPQATAYPAVEVKVDRARAGQFGVTAAQVGKAVVGATSSSALVVPNFWVDTKTGVPYRVAVRVPENQMTSIQDVRSLPVMPQGARRPLLDDVATVAAGTTPGEIDHMNSQRTVTVTANLAGTDLRRAAAGVRSAIRDLGQLPKGTTVAMHGQAEQMQATLTSLWEGLALAVLAVLLLLVASFQSAREAIVALSSVPGVLAGVVLALLVTRTSLNIESLMGAIMAVGVAVASSLLLVTVARTRRAAGDTPVQAIAAGARSRMRPVLMTSLAMIAGMIPMSLGWGEGGEQTAPLGRAVIGGLVASTVATLLFLPAVYATIIKPGVRSWSLAPEPSPAAPGTAGGSV